MRFLGAAGFVLQRGSDTIVTGPFFSNPGLLRTWLFPIRADRGAIERWMPHLPDAAAILVGHGHYDHLMDVPAVRELKAPNAVVYASDSSVHVLAAADADLNAVALDDYAWSCGHEQRWIHIPGTRVRFLAIASEHAPHFHGLKFYGGSYDRDQSRVPSRACGWKEGLVLEALAGALTAVCGAGRSARAGLGPMRVILYTIGDRGESLWPGSTVLAGPPYRESP